MLDVHPPHEAIHTWKAFLIHIVAIAIGLLIAVGLEQTVEFFHHRHQRLQLEEQMHEIFEDNVALLSTQRIRLYNRVALQRDLARSLYERWFEDLADIDAFRKRFDYSLGSSVRGGIDLASLSPAELTEYQALIGSLMSRVDWMIKRLGIFAAEGQAILDGARDENDLVKSLRASPDANPGAEAVHK
jgi:hypothetical protein